DLLEAAADHLHFVREQGADVAVVVTEEALGVDREDALASLFVRGRDAVDHRPRRPRVDVGPLVRWAGEDLELVDRRRAGANRRPAAARPGLTTADDDDVLAGCGDRRLLEIAFLHLVGPRQVLHRLVDAGELAARDRKIAPRGRAAGEDDGVVLVELAGRDVDADVRVRAELRALGRHLHDPAFEMPLLH